MPLNYSYLVRKKNFNVTNAFWKPWDHRSYDFECPLVISRDKCLPDILQSDQEIVQLQAKPHTKRHSRSKSQFLYQVIAIILSIINGTET